MASVEGVSPGRNSGEWVGSDGGGLSPSSQRRERGGGRWKRAAAIVARLNKLNQRALAATATAALASLILGYGLGVSSTALLYVQQSSPLVMTSKELFVASLNYAAALGALLAGRLSDVIGRRKCLAVTSVLSVAGAILAASSSSFASLMLSQLVYGLGSGFGLVVCPLYAAELAPAEHRGLLVSLADVGTNLGLALGHLSAFTFGSNWRRMLGMAAVPAAALGGAALLLLPESPRWLALAGRVREAAQALLLVEEREEQAALVLEDINEAAGLGRDVPLALVHDGHAVSQPVVGGRRSSSASAAAAAPYGLPSWLSTGADVWKDLVWPSVAVKSMLLMSFGLAFFQQASGMDVTLAYLPELLSVMGLSTRGAVFCASLAVVVAKAAANVVALALVDDFGRRPLLLISASGMSAGLFLQAVIMRFLNIGVTIDEASLAEPLSAYDHPRKAGAAVLAIISTCNIAALFSLGLGPLMGLVQSESFPLRLRAQAVGASVAVNRLTVAVVSSSFLTLSDATSPSVPYFAFALFTLVAAAFLHLSVKETKGTSLEDACSLYTGAHGVGSPSSHSVEKEQSSGGGRRVRLTSFSSEPTHML